MTATAPTPVLDTDLQGWKYFRRLTRLLARLHDAGCLRDKAGNRSLHLDHYCTLILLALFNPIARSLLLISLWTGRKPTQRTYEMLCWYFLGWATEEELLAHLEKLKKQSRE